MATTYEAIATVEVGSGGAASISFTSIAADWTDLVLKLSARCDLNSTGTEQLLYKFNSTTSGYSTRALYSYSSGSPASGTFTTASKSGSTWGRIGDGEVTRNGASITANTFSNNEIYISNYAGSNYKSFSVDSVTENNSTSYSELELIAGLWSNTAAITQIDLALLNGDFMQYSTATLYGIKNS